MYSDIKNMLRYQIFRDIEKLYICMLSVKYRFLWSKLASMHKIWLSIL